MGGISERCVGLVCLMLGVGGFGSMMSVAHAQTTDPAQLDALARVQDSQDQRRAALEAAQQQLMRQQAMQQPPPQRQETQRRQVSGGTVSRTASERSSQGQTDGADDRRDKLEQELKDQQLRLELIQKETQLAQQQAEFAQKRAEFAQQQAGVGGAAAQQGGAKPSGQQASSRPGLLPQIMQLNQTLHTLFSKGGTQADPPAAY